MALLGQSAKPLGTMKNSDIRVVNVRITRDLARQLDILIQKKVFTSRSEAIREFCREYIRENRKGGLP